MMGMMLRSDVAQLQMVSDAIRDWHLVANLHLGDVRSPLASAAAQTAVQFQWGRGGAGLPGRCLILLEGFVFVVAGDWSLVLFVVRRWVRGRGRGRRWWRGMENGHLDEVGRDGGWGMLLLLL